MEYSLSQRLVAGKCRRRTAVREPEHRRRVKNGVPVKVRRVGDFLGAFGDVGESIEKVPERSSVSNGVIDGDADEESVGELGDFDGG